MIVQLWKTNILVILYFWTVICKGQVPSENIILRKFLCPSERERTKWLYRVRLVLVADPRPFWPYTYSKSFLSRDQFHEWTATHWRLFFFLSMLPRAHARPIVGRMRKKSVLLMRWDLYNLRCRRIIKTLLCSFRITCNFMLSIYLLILNILHKYVELKKSVNL